jgi:hypothetical protein
MTLALTGFGTAKTSKIRFLPHSKILTQDTATVSSDIRQNKRPAELENLGLAQQ